MVPKESRQWNLGVFYFVVSVFNSSELSMLSMLFLCKESNTLCIVCSNVSLSCLLASACNGQLLNFVDPFSLVIPLCV